MNLEELNETLKKCATCKSRYVDNKVFPCNVCSRINITSDKWEPKEKEQ